ncbi:MAG: DinB family protein [Imperialibacter sp.]|uniref:DinB family protein n=1 Tax=Imperialibacter sp. TaxID=2038411 RepID=UPI003A85547B
MNQQELFIKMALDAWNIYIERTNKLFDGLSDEQIAAEVAPNRNTGTYLLGHLAAVHDNMIPLLSIGEKLYPELYEPYVRTPDKSGQNTPIPELRTAWNKVNSALSAAFEKFTADDWFTRHTAVTEEDFAKEPHRNKLNLVMNRTAHLANHLGQLAFLKPRG